MSTTVTPPFEEHYLAAHHGLRSALTELLLTTGADPDAPQAVARRFRLNRNLTWKVSRVVRGTDPYAVFPQIPGQAALRILLKAFRSAGASPAATRAVEQAAAEFERMITVHAGDRATMELMLDSLAPNGVQSEPLEVSRKLAFRGNSGIWGLQAKVRLRTLFLAPNAEDPDWLDFAEVSGLVRLRRFRHDAVVPLFDKGSWNDDGSAREVRDEPLLPGPPGREDTRLLAEFCSQPLPEIRVVPHALGALYELAGGAVGELGAATVLYGNSTRRFAPRHGDEHNTYGELVTQINAPCESLLIDVIVHRDVANEMQLEPSVYQGGPQARSERRAPQFPCHEQLQDLGAGPPRVTTPLVPRYGELVEAVFARQGWDPTEFHGLRYEMKYPPTPSSVVLAYRLPIG